MHVVCYTAVFSVVTQRWGGALRDDIKNGYAANYVLAEVVDQSTSLIRALQEPGDIQPSGHHGL